MKILDRRNMGQYVLFFDNGDELRAGKLYDMENSELLVHSLRINSRGESKLYYYRINDSNIFEFVSRESAVQFVHKRKHNKNKVLDYIDVESNRFVRKLLIAMKDQMDFTVQQDKSYEYDGSLDDFGLDELDYKMLSLILSKSEYTSLYARTTQAYWSEIIGDLFSSPSISDHYAVILRLVYIQLSMHSVSVYRDGTLKKGEFDDILNNNIVAQTNWRFITGLEFTNTKSGDIHLKIGLNISPYTNIIEFMINRKSNAQIKLFSTKNISLLEYLLNRVMSELVSNNACLVFEFKELKGYGFFDLKTDESMKEPLVSAMKDLCDNTSLKIDYHFSSNEVELKLKQIENFNRYFFNRNEDCVKAGVFIKTISNMISSDE
ncbi:MAG: hypothetical protein JJU16_01270 [Alkalibacterium sp.]|nr:hypothetical protein [Alkalibacterium sp.]